jgi:serine/threonine protein kinase/CheY-like chemotaxis protein
MNPFSILLVDDDEQFLPSLVTLLQDEGFPVTSASSAQAAMELIERDKPRVIILDLMMPETPGDELCRIIKDDPYLRDIIVIILSAASDVETKLTCFASGANEYLVKPVDGRELVARIKRFIRMIDEFKNAPASAGHTKLQTFPVDSATEDKHGTLDLGSAGSGESFARIKPKYGIYQIETLIGSGSMGYVFKGYDEPLDRYVAIKILSKKLSGSPEFVERFRREAKVLAAINHPGIAYIYSFGQEDEDHYFAMQWCSGGTLSDLIRSKERVGVLPTVDIILQCAQALSAASKKGVVHRDIKPSNLLLDENQQVKIVDFGLASAEKFNSEITAAHEFLGTPTFMAPEQAQSSAVDQRADIYSLGITFYYMLYGKAPFTANSAIEMVVRHATEPFPAYDDLGGRIPPEVYDIISKMTQKSPENRYQDYSALIQDLEKVRSVLLSQSQLKAPRAQSLPSSPLMRGISFFEMLSDINQKNLSGVLVSKWATLSKKLLIRQHEFLLFESNQPDESIWKFLQHKNILTADELPTVKEDMEIALSKFLLEHRFPMEQFKIAYRELMKGAVMQVFLWPLFEGEFYPATIEHDAFVRIPINDVLLEACRTFLDFSSLKSELPPTVPIRRTAEFEQVLSALNLKPEESFILSRIEGSDITLNTLQALTGLPEPHIGRFLYALMKMGAIRFATSEERHPPPQRPRHVPEPRVITPPAMPASGRNLAPPAPPRPDPTPTPIPAVVAPPTLQRQAYTPPPQANYPTPVPDLAHNTPIPKQDGGYLQELANKRFAAPAEEKEKAGDPLVRMEVHKSDKKIEVEHYIKVAEQFFRLAEEKFELEDYWKVAQLCKQAIKNHPTESKYYHLMATAYAKHPRFGKDAEQCFYKALEMDPWNPDYHVDLAWFYLSQGLSKRALTHCEKALQIMPHHEKAKALMVDIKAAHK